VFTNDGRSDTFDGFETRPHAVRPKAPEIEDAMRLLAALPTIALLMAPLGQTTAAQQREKVDVSKLGPQVGQQVPTFSLKDQTGKVQTLQSIMGPKGAMLVFLRSADW